MRTFTLHCAVWTAALTIALAVSSCLAADAAPTQEDAAMTAAPSDPTLISKIRREGERVWIEDVPRPEGSVSSLASLAAILQARGEDVDYTYLMGVSSRAFRLQFSWCPSAPHAYIGFDCFQPALRAMGYEWKEHAGEFSFLVKPAAKATPEEQAETRQVVKREIDAGRALLFGSEEDAVLVGYEPISEENPTGWLRRPGPHGGPQDNYTYPIKQMPWGVSSLKKVGDPLSRREAAEWALKTAVDNARRGTVEGKQLKTGLAALDEWIDQLQPEKFDAMVSATKRELEAKDRGNEDATWGICLGNAWTYQNLREARREAAKYLRDAAPDLPEAARADLLIAAEAYERVADILETKSAEEGEPCAFDYVPYPWRLKDVASEWTAAMRAQQAKSLEAALPHERAAVEALEAALAAMTASD